MCERIPAKVRQIHDETKRRLGAMECHGVPGLKGEDPGGIPWILTGKNNKQSNIGITWGFYWI
jgi:hypothetical protein